MIIKMLLDLLYGVFSLLTVSIDIPNLPPDLLSYFNNFMDYICGGMGILANYTPLNYLVLLFTISVAYDVGVSLYHFVMWILRKIPVLGIE